MEKIKTPRRGSFLLVGAIFIKAAKKWMQIFISPDEGVYRYGEAGKWKK